jgi:hypothetical protein
LASAVWGSRAPRDGVVGWGGGLSRPAPAGLPASLRAGLATGALAFPQAAFTRASLGYFRCWTAFSILATALARASMALASSFSFSSGVRRACTRFAAFIAVVVFMALTLSFASAGPRPTWPHPVVRSQRHVRRWWLSGAPSDLPVRWGIPALLMRLHCPSRVPWRP